MNKFILAALCGLFLLTANTPRVRAGECGWGKCGGGGYCCFNFAGCGIGFWGKNTVYSSCDCSFCGIPRLGPWYLYWPYAAHFQTPAPTGYPYWPAPMTVGSAGEPMGGGHYPYYWGGH